MIVSNILGSFISATTVTGGTSGATGTIAEGIDSDRGLLRIKNVSGTFQLNEPISSPPKLVSPSVDRTLNIPFSRFSTDTSNVPPPKS